MALAIAVALCLGFALGRASQRKAKPSTASSAPLVFESTVVHRITSEAGLRYKLIISLPHSYHHVDATGQRYPVVYALDGEPYLFPLLATVARTEHFFKRTTWFPDLIIVGITADLEENCQSTGSIHVKQLWDALRLTRARDYLPTQAESPWGAPGALPLKDVSGHASTFCQFLASELVPHVDRHFRTVATKSSRALIGKSFGGSGVAHGLLEPQCAACFQYFLLGSPSLAWDDRAFFRLEDEAFSKQGGQPLTARVYASCGGKEPNQLQLLQDFKERLESRAYPDLSVTLEIVEGEDHGSLSYPFACRSMRWLRDGLETSS